LQIIPILPFLVSVVHENENLSGMINYEELRNYPAPPSIVNATRFILESCDSSTEFVKQYFNETGINITMTANFWLVCNIVYLGRGWDKFWPQEGEFQSTTINIIVIVIRNDAVDLSLNQFIEEGVFLGKIHKEYRIIEKVVNNTSDSELTTITSENESEI
jgi:hypothetical protein